MQQAEPLADGFIAILSNMRPDFYEEMEQLFSLVAHDYQEISAAELLLYQLARGNAYHTRVSGLNAIKRFRQTHPDCSITFKPTHFSEADFILLGLLFRENGLRVLTEGGSNLFIEDIDVFRDLLPQAIHPDLKESFYGRRMSIARYLSTRGAFKVFRSPVSAKQPDGEEIQIGVKQILMLSRAYRRHLVKQREMYVTFPGYSRVKPRLLDILKKEEEVKKTGRSYTGRIDGFLHLPFQMDIEASQETGVDVHVVPVNIAYSPVLEDELFAELRALNEAGADPNEIYRKDLGYILKAFSGDGPKGDLSIKFGDPIKIDIDELEEGRKGTKAKKAAQKLARETFDRIRAMQPVFPANIYFSAFDRKYSGISIKKMKERIDDRRKHLQTLLWGKDRRRVDLHYILDYRNQIISADEIINRTFGIFNTLSKQVTAREGDMFVVTNSDVAMQYRNHTAHFF